MYLKYDDPDAIYTPDELEWEILKDRHETIGKILKQKSFEYPLDYCLFPAIQRNNVAVFKALLERGANPDVSTTEGLRPVHLSVGWGRYQILEVLISNGVNINVSDNCNATPLHMVFAWAAFELRGLVRLSPNVLEFFLNHERYLNALGDLPEMVFLRDLFQNIDFLKITRSLLSEGAIVTAKDNNDRTPLDWAKFIQAKYYTTPFFFSRRNTEDYLDEIIELISYK